MPSIMLSYFDSFVFFTETMDMATMVGTATTVLLAAVNLRTTPLCASSEFDKSKMRHYPPMFGLRRKALDNL